MEVREPALFFLYFVTSRSHDPPLYLAKSFVRL